MLLLYRQGQEYCHGGVHHVSHFVYLQHSLFYSYSPCATKILPFKCWKATVRVAVQRFTLTMLQESGEPAGEVCLQLINLGISQLHAASA